MALKRFTTEELVEKCKEVFYDYFSSNSGLWYKGEDIPCSMENPTPAHLFHDQILKTINSHNERIELYKEALEALKDTENLKLISEQIEYLEKINQILYTSNMEFQKKRRKSGTMPYSCSLIRVPLNKQINSFYDDFFLEVLFFDDVTTLKGKYTEYEKLQTTEQRREFIKANTEITHMGLIITSSAQGHLATVQLMGKLNYEDSRVKAKRILLLDSRFSDFSNLTLKDTMCIQNNDLKQLFQSKIDLDKENMDVLAEKLIRGDYYKVLKSENNLWIRYVCPSTGRVYYNTLVERNLKVSDYFKENNYESYIDSWWNICHMGEPVEGKPVIRC